MGFRRSTGICCGVSEACLAEVADRDDLEVIDGPFEMPFDENGNLAAVGIGH